MTRAVDKSEVMPEKRATIRAKKNAPAMISASSTRRTSATAMASTTSAMAKASAIVQTVISYRVIITHRN